VVPVSSPCIIVHWCHASILKCCTQIACHPAHTLGASILKFNFNARDDEDLSFHKGELLNIIEKHEPEWWRAQSQETLQIGVVPVSVLIAPLSLFYAAPSRDCACARTKEWELDRLSPHQLYTGDGHVLSNVTFDTPNRGCVRGCVSP
jgi:hypothetical protein